MRVFIQQIFERSGNAIGSAVRNIDLCRLYRDVGGVDRFGVLSGTGNSHGLGTERLQRRLRQIDGVSNKTDHFTSPEGELVAVGPYEKFREAAADWLTQVWRTPLDEPQ